MAKVFDVRGSGGQFVIIGDSLVLPSGPIGHTLTGSLRFNPCTGNTDFFDGVSWTSFISSKQAGTSIATLDASGKIPLAQLANAISGGLTFQGVWNAATNTPTLASGIGSNGDFYTVSAAGSTTLDEQTDWVTGDIVIFATTWNKLAGVVESSGVSLTPPSDDNSDLIATTKYVRSQGYLSENPPITLTGVISGSGNSTITTTFAPIATGVLANLADDDAPPLATSLSAMLDKLVGATTGGLLHRNDDGWHSLAPGAIGTVLYTTEHGVQWREPVSVDTQITRADIVAALGYTPRSEDVTLTAADVTNALGYLPQVSIPLEIGFSGSILSSPYTNGQILARFAIGFPVTLPRDLIDSTALCLSVPVNDSALSILKNGSVIGTINFTAGSEHATFSCDATYLTIADILELDGPNPADATFGNLTFTIVGLR